MPDHGKFKHISSRFNKFVPRMFQKRSKTYFVQKLTSYNLLSDKMRIPTERKRDAICDACDAGSRFVTLVIAVPYLHHKLTTFVALLLWNYQNVWRYEETWRTLWGTSMNRIGDQWIETTTPIWILSFFLAFCLFCLTRKQRIDALFLIYTVHTVNCKRVYHVKLLRRQI